jgi:hypothetical protein
LTPVESPKRMRTVVSFERYQCCLLSWSFFAVTYSSCQIESSSASVQLSLYLIGNVSHILLKYSCPIFQYESRQPDSDRFLWPIVHVQSVWTTANLLRIPRAWHIAPIRRGATTQLVSTPALVSEFKPRIRKSLSLAGSLARLNGGCRWPSSDRTMVVQGLHGDRVGIASKRCPTTGLT